MAMVNSAKGITNLHVPSDVIVDASMAAAVRDAGQMWNKEDKLQDTRFVVPDRCYAGIYDVIIKDCIKNGELDVRTCGATSNVSTGCKDLWGDVERIIINLDFGNY